MKKDVILQIKWIHSAHTNTNASDLFSIQVPELQEGREKPENFVGRKNRLFSNERELDSPWATLEPVRQWTGTGGAASSLHPAKMSLLGHGKRKTFQTCEDTKHTLSIKCTRGKYPVKFCLRRTVRAELLRKGK